MIRSSKKHSPKIGVRDSPSWRESARILGKEFDTYKVGTVANSTSTMHKVMENPFNLTMFEIEDFLPSNSNYRIWDIIITRLNLLQENYLKLNKEGDSEGAKILWKEVIRLLPSAWLQTRTITLNYENLYSMYFQRKSHKLTEWHRFCEWIETLPYTQMLFFKVDKIKKI